MFKRKELLRLWRQTNSNNIGILKNGKIVNLLDEEVKIPSMDTIANTALEHLRQTGFCVQRASSLKSGNCVLRTYACTSLPKGDKIFWVYGANLFVKNFLQYRDSYNQPFDPKVCSVNYWLHNGFNINKPFFMDIYLYVSRD